MNRSTVLGGLLAFVLAVSVPLVSNASALFPTAAATASVTAAMPTKATDGFVPGWNTVSVSAARTADRVAKAAKAAKAAKPAKPRRRPRLRKPLPQQRRPRRPPPRRLPRDRPPSVARRPRRSPLPRPSCPANVGGSTAGAPARTSKDGVAGTTSADLASFASAYNAIRVAHCLAPIPMSNIRYDSCLEDRLFWIAGDPSTDVAAAWGHAGTVTRSDGVAEYGCDGNLAGGTNNSGATVAQKWWDSPDTAPRCTAPAPRSGLCISFATGPRRRERPRQLHPRRRPLGSLLVASLGPVRCQPGSEGSIMAETIRWGILGAGRHRPRRSPRICSLTGRTVTAVGSRSREPAQSLRRRVRHRARPRQLREPRRRPRGRHHLRRDPAPLPRRACDPRARRRQARAGREAVHPERRRGARGSRRRRESEACSLLEAMWTRFLPHMVRIREIIAAGALGEIRTRDRRPQPEAAEQSRAPPAEPGPGRWRPARPRHLPGLVRVGHVRCPRDHPGERLRSRRPESTGRPPRSSATPTVQQAVLHTALRHRGPNTATIIGTEGCIEIDRVWYTRDLVPVLSSAGEVLERSTTACAGRGMQYQAFEVERLIAAGDRPMSPCSRSPSRSPSWGRSTRSVVRSACATPASEASPARPAGPGDVS